MLLGSKDGGVGLSTGGRFFRSFASIEAKKEELAAAKARAAAKAEAVRLAKIKAEAMRNAGVLPPSPPNAIERAVAVVKRQSPATLALVTAGVVVAGFLAWKAYKAVRS